jgi:hypothetical protein
MLEAGEAAFYITGRDMPIGFDCCGDLTNAELLPAYRREEPEAELMIDAAEVMPRGRSLHDICKKCFQIPSNSGVCGCVS